MSQICRASSISRRTWSREDFSVNRRLRDNRDVLEDIALSDDVGALANLKRVSAVVIPVVVDGMEEGVSLNLW